MVGRSARELAERVEQLVAKVDSGGDLELRNTSKALVTALVDLYGSGLERILEIVHESVEDAGPVFDRLAADELVSSLLILHGLHPEALESRIEAALAGVRPYLQSHAGDVALVGIEGGDVYLRLEGSCQGCPSSSLTMKLAVEEAIRKAAPEIERIMVEGVESSAQRSELLQIGSRPQPIVPRWVDLGAQPALSRRGLIPLEVEGTKLVLCEDQGQIFAYKNRCSACGSTLDHAAIAGDVLACGSCGARYDIRAAGRALEPNVRHLDPLPLLSENDRVRVAVPT